MNLIQNIKEFLVICGWLVSPNFIGIQIMRCKIQLWNFSNRIGWWSEFEFWFWRIIDMSNQPDLLNLYPKKGATNIFNIPHRGMYSENSKIVVHLKFFNHKISFSCFLHMKKLKCFKQEHVWLMTTAPFKLLIQSSFKFSGNNQNVINSSTCARPARKKWCICKLAITKVGPLFTLFVANFDGIKYLISLK